MHTRVNLTLRSEARRYGLRFTCEHCVHLASPSDCDLAGEREVALELGAREASSGADPEEYCSLGYPLAAHHRIDLERAESITFCKAFELD